MPALRPCSEAEAKLRPPAARAAGRLNTFWNVRPGSGAPLQLPPCDWGPMLTFVGPFRGYTVGWKLAELRMPAAQPLCISICPCISYQPWLVPCGCWPLVAQCMQASIAQHCLIVLIQCTHFTAPGCSAQASCGWCRLCPLAPRPTFTMLSAGCDASVRQQADVLGVLLAWDPWLAKSVSRSNAIAAIIPSMSFCALLHESSPNMPICLSKLSLNLHRRPPFVVPRPTFCYTCSFVTSTHAVVTRFCAIIPDSHCSSLPYPLLARCL